MKDKTIFKDSDFDIKVDHLYCFNTDFLNHESLRKNMFIVWVTEYHDILALYHDVRCFIGYVDREEKIIFRMNKGNLFGKSEHGFLFFHGVNEEIASILNIELDEVGRWIPDEYNQSIIDALTTL